MKQTLHFPFLPGEAKAPSLNFIIIVYVSYIFHWSSYMYRYIIYTITRTIHDIRHFSISYTLLWCGCYASHESSLRVTPLQLCLRTTEAVGPKVRANYKRFVNGERANSFRCRGKAGLWREICSAVARVSPPSSRFWLHAFGSLLINRIFITNRTFCSTLTSPALSHRPQFTRFTSYESFTYVGMYSATCFIYEYEQFCREILKRS